MVEKIILTIYPVLWFVLIFTGVKIAGRRTVSKDFLSLEQSKLIRGAACIGVIFHHVTQQITQYGMVDKGPVTMFNWAGFLFTAVFFFFSGYGLILNVYGRKDYLHTFLTKRIPAVLIPFWIVNACFVIVEILVYHTHYVPVNAIKDVFGVTLLNGNGWFIIEIVVIYLAFFVLFDLIKKKDVALTLLCIFVILLIRFAFFRGHDAPGAKTSWFRGEWWFNSTLTFVFGMLFARVKEKIVPFLNKFYIAVLPLTMVLFYITFLYSIVRVKYHGYYGSFQVGVGPRSMFITMLSQSAACVVFALLIILLNMKISVGNPVLRFIGSISMELFLIHGYFVNRVFGSMKISSAMRYVVVLLCSFVCTSLAAPAIGLVKRKVIALTGRLEIYDIIPVGNIFDKIKKSKIDKLNKKLVLAGAAAISVLIIAIFAVRAIVLKSQCTEECKIIKMASPGDVVFWGHFQTDDDPFLERLEWIVVENYGGKVSLITKQGIAAASYNQKHEEISWEESDIRGIINGDRFMKIFSSDELSCMLTSEGEYISLPTVSDIVTLFPTEKERELSITTAAEHDGANINSLSKANEWDLKGYRSSWWWLKGEETSVYAPIVTVDGVISEKEVNRPGGAVRLMIRLDLSENQQ